MSTADLLRPVARLLADVTEFMTLAPGDVLAAGAAAPAPRVRAGQTVAIEADVLGTLSNSVRGGRGMMRARVAFAGAIHEATPLQSGRASAACASRMDACSARRRSSGCLPSMSAP